jgi:hypothetical protein
VCREADRLREEARQAADSLRVARSELTAARLAQEEAQAAADGRRMEQRKAAARQAYRRALNSATDVTERQRAAAAWLNEIDLINRAARMAMGTLVESQARAIALEQQAEGAHLFYDAKRIRAEAAEAACAEARSNVADVDRPSDSTPVPVLDAPAQTSGRPMLAIPIESDQPPASDPLLIERLLDGNQEAFHALARAMSELTGGLASRYLLLLRELVDAIAGSAADAGMLVFDHGHPFWSQFSPAEAREIARVLRDLGFRFDPVDGWYGRRAPAFQDLALALAYAGYDVRSLRRLPVGDELRGLPSSVTISSLEHLVAGAPDLDVDQVLRLLGSRGDRLGDLWDDWAKLRALLLESTLAVPA